MSRSFQKTPITGYTTARSEKDDKRRANRRHRTAVKRILRTELEPETLPLLREVSNVYTFAKDGKQYWTKDTQLTIATAWGLYICPDFSHAHRIKAYKLFGK